MEHDQSSYFCRNPDNFCWGPAPVDPTLVTGLRAVETINCFERRPINQKVKMRPPKNASVVSVAENLKYSPVYTIVLCLVAIRFTARCYASAVLAMDGLPFFLQD